MLSYRQPFREMRMSPSARTAKKIRQFHSALIIDDHPLFCDALAMTLNAPLGIADVEAVGTLAAALDRLSSGTQPDILLLDLNLPDVHGLDGVVRLRKKAPETPIVVVSSLDEPRVIRAALKAGVNGFIPKHAPREEFSQAFELIAKGEIYASRIFLEPAAPSMSDAAVEKLATLTKQQARILELISAGWMNKQIAFELSIAETTVKAHVTAILRKLGVQTRMHAVLFAQEANFNVMTLDS